MHKAHKPTQLTRPPLYSHSVYGLGQFKPKLVGLKDVNRGLRGEEDGSHSFLPSEMTVCSPEALFFNTGKLGANNDIQEVIGATSGIEQVD
jgi:hypothetical protein